MGRLDAWAPGQGAEQGHAPEAARGTERSEYRTGEDVPKGILAERQGWAMRR